MPRRCLRKYSLPLELEPEVGPPYVEHARPVVRGVRILAGEAQLAALELPDRLRDRVLGLRQVQWIAVEGRVRGHPAHARARRQAVRARHPLEGPAGQRGGEGLGRQGVVAPLVGVQVEPGRADHLARRARPVGGGREGGPAGDRAALLLTHVVAPAAAVAALAAGEGEQGEERAVDGLRVEPVVRARAHQDHAAALRLLRRLGELPCHARRLGCRNRGQRLLPAGGAGRGRVLVPRRPDAGQTLAADPVLGQHQVEDGGDEPVPEATYGHTAADRPALPAIGVHAPLVVLEAGQDDLDAVVGGAVQGQARDRVAEFEVPLRLLVLAPAVTEGAVRDDGLAGRVVDQHGLPLRVLGVLSEVGGGDELSGNQALAGLGERNQERQVGVLPDVVGEEGGLLLDEEFLEDDVAHREGQSAVRTGVRVHPFVGEFRVVGEIRGDRDDLLAAVAGLGHPVGVGGAGDGDVGAPHHQVGGVPPVTGLGDVRLVAEDLRGGDREVGVPVVEGQHRRADERVETGAGRVRSHRHRGDRREAGDPVRAVLLDGVHVRGGDDLRRLLPGRTHQSALAARPLVRTTALGIGLDVGPGLDRIAQPQLGLAVHLQEGAADVGVAHPGGRVGVPGERGSARAAARLVLGAVRTDGGVVGGLGLPGDDPVLDVHLPPAGAGAVHAVSGVHDLVVAPTVPVERLRGAATGLVDGAQVVRDLAAREETARLDQRFGGVLVFLTSVALVQGDPPGRNKGGARPGQDGPDTTLRPVRRRIR